MSNDTRIIIPEVKYQAVGAHCKKLDIQGCHRCTERMNRGKVAEILV
jgi:hypothetical protein